MKYRIALAAAVCAVALSACAYHAPNAGPKMVYYDGAYGAYYGGFWGSDGVFYYYTDASLTAAKRDDAHHFHEGMQNHREALVEARAQNRAAERVANGLPPEQQSAELRYYVH